jgi:hypothetical protein
MSFRGCLTRLCIAAVALMLPWPAVAADYLGRVTAVADGETSCSTNTSNAGFRIRSGALAIRTTLVAGASGSRWGPPVWPQACPMDPNDGNCLFDTERGSGAAKEDTPAPHRLANNFTRPGYRETGREKSAPPARSRIRFRP